MLPAMIEAGTPRTVLPKRCPTCGERFPADFRVCPRDAVELEVVVGGVDDPYICSILANSYRIDAVIAEGGQLGELALHLGRKTGRGDVLHAPVSVQLLHRERRPAKAPLPAKSKPRAGRFL